MDDPMPDFSTKTIFLIIRTPAFLKCFDEDFKFEPGSKSHESSKQSKIKVQKPLWSYVGEAVFEYCRIVFDLYSAAKPVSLITVNSGETIHSLWYEEDQSLEVIWNHFSAIGMSKASISVEQCSQLPGINSCKNMLQLMTPQQSKGIVNGNYGRVIVVGTNIKLKLSYWLSDIVKQLSETTHEDGYLAIDATEWMFVDINDKQEKSSLSQVSFEEIQASADTKHHFFYSNLSMWDRGIFTGMMLLAERHLNLASTLVQDIPMKEEANVASSSSMYGVELLHDAAAHRHLSCLGLTSQLYLRNESCKARGDEIYQRPPSGFSKTLGIKWVTPRAIDTNTIRYCTAAYRVTMAAVGNRASVCLAQFVLGGRSVALAHHLPTALPLSSGSPAVSTASVSGQLANSVHHEFTDSCCHAQPTNEVFLLLCHGSVMYLHVLANASPMSHPPILSINHNYEQYNHANKNNSNNNGDRRKQFSCGRPLDPASFRLAAFTKNFLHPARLAPASARQTYALTPKDRALQHVERCTRYLPLLEDSTIIGNNSLAQPLFEHLPKDFLEPQEVSACKQSVEMLLEFIGAHPVLKECGDGLAYSQPVAMALELHHFLRECADVSDEHDLLWTDWQRRAEDTRLTAAGVGSGTSLSLSTLIKTAEHLLIHYYRNEVMPSEVPQQKNVALFQLSHLAAQLLPTSTLSDSDDSNANLQTISGSVASVHNQATNFNISQITPETFMRQFLQASHKPPAARAEFAGVQNCNAKGVTRLYVGIIEEV